MIFSTSSQSLVLFGVNRLTASYLSAELVLYSEGLSREISIKDIETKEKLKLLVPKEIQNSILPGIANDMTFLIA
jgi:hypothetical protein